jgi:type III secretion protein L
MNAPLIAPLGRILRAREVGLYRTAEAALHVAETAASEIRSVAASDIEASRTARLADAEQEARRRTVQILAETSAAAQRSLASLPREIAEAIAEGVAKVIGGIDLAEAVARAAQRALTELTERHAVTVRVNPQALGPTRMGLARRDGGVVVVADPGLAPDACIVETPAGFVRAGLEEQIATLRAALTAAAHGND